MLNTYYDLPVSFFGSEVISAKNENSPSDLSSKKVTSVATEILEMAHGLKEYGQLYKDKPLMDRFKNGNNIDNLALAKIQRRFTTLKDRVEILIDVDPRIEGVFKKMVKVGIDNGSKRGGLESINQDVLSLIGKKNIIDSGPFSKHGIICVKDSAMPDPRPSNLVSATELKEMKALRKKVLDPKEGLFKINVKGLPDIFASSKFITKTKNSLEKLLTHKAGRELIKNLCDLVFQDVYRITIKPGVVDVADPDTDTVLLSQKILREVGIESGSNVSINTPRWITLGHELIHMLHYYDKTIDGNDDRKDIPDMHLWSNGEEYVTIGDPTKPINPISENGLRQNSLHPLRRYHVSSVPYSGDFIQLLKTNQVTREQIKDSIDLCCQTWDPLLASKLLDHSIGQQVVKEYFHAIYPMAERNEDQNTIDRMRNLFPLDYKHYEEN